MIDMLVRGVDDRVEAALGEHRAVAVAVRQGGA
jgi:hypothetical protein